MKCRTEYRRFDNPTQIKFYNPIDERWLGGIAYEDKIICGECGQVIPLKDIYDETDIEMDPIKIFKWISISEEILGDEA